MPLLIAIVAIAIDAGVLFDKRRHAQAAADAAALAAAGDLFNTYSNAVLADDGKDLGGTAKAHALSIAADNGYTNDGTNSVVGVYIPPITGQYIGQDGYVEVTIEYRQSRSFSRIFASDVIPVRTRAVARGRWAPAGIGILCLDPLSAASLKIQGQAHAEVPLSGVLVNSIDPVAADGGGQGGTITAKSFEITGGYNESGGQQFFGPIRTGVPPTPDPYRQLPEPDPSTMPVRTLRDATVIDLGGGYKKYILEPGVYPNGLSFSGQDSVELKSGIFYMQGGGFKFSGTDLTSLKADKVMLFNGVGINGKAGDISITGNGSVTWTPPIDGLYRGLSFFQARGVTQTITIAGNGNMNIKGAYYARDALIDIGGNGTNYVGNQFICWNMFFHGSGTYIVPWEPGTIQPVRDLKLVE
jgi:hypothetical protein